MRRDNSVKIILVIATILADAAWLRRATGDRQTQQAPRGQDVLPIPNRLSKVKSAIRRVRASHSTRPLDFGEDTVTPVVEDYAAKMPFKFTGKLDKFAIRLTENKLTVAEERELTDLTRRAAAVRQ